MGDPASRFTIWIDGDGTPRGAKEVVYRAAERREVPVVIVANRAQQTPRTKWVRSVVVGAGFDVADEHIAEQCQQGDLVITGDIPLAAEVIEKGAFALQPRGEMLTVDNVRQRLAMRDFMDEMRAGGALTGGPPAYGPSDKQRFANAMDRFLTGRGR